MPCESCAVQFSVFRRKRSCSECERNYCAACLRRGGGAMCAACRVLSTRPLSRSAIVHLKVRDLQSFLQRQNVSTRGCVEKEELVSLCVMHVNSSSYKRRGPRTTTFSTLKGFTNNINEFITSTFDLRNTPNPQPQDNRGSCYNATHAHPPAPPARRPSAADPPPPTDATRFTTTPGGERDISVPVPEPAPEAESPDAVLGERVETHDCFEVEDLDDAGWEFVTKPADPLPNDSEVLMMPSQSMSANLPPPSPSPPPSAPAQQPQPAPAPRGVRAEGEGGPGGSPRGLRVEGEEGAGGTPRRAASVLELSRGDEGSGGGAGGQRDADRASLQDEPLMDAHTTTRSRGSKKLALEQLHSAAELETLSVRALKELLARNRVEYRGCLERRDLLERARTLYADHAKYRDEIDNLPIEECCKICMAAPLECVLLECGHIAACTRCATQLAECPICRQYVVRAVRCFRS